MQDTVQLVKTAKQELKALRAWKHPHRTALVMSVHLITVYAFQPWMPPLYALIAILYLQRQPRVQTQDTLEEDADDDDEDDRDDADHHKKKVLG